MEPNHFAAIKDPILLQLKAKVQKEEYFEEILHQTFGTNTLLPKHLLKELICIIHGTAHQYPGIFEMLQKICQKYYTQD